MSKAKGKACSAKPEPSNGISTALITHLLSTVELLSFGRVETGTDPLFLGSNLRKGSGRCRCHRPQLRGNSTASKSHTQ
jgi:hypothetical protein